MENSLCLYVEGDREEKKEVGVGEDHMPCCVHRVCSVGHRVSCWKWGKLPLTILRDCVKCGEKRHHCSCGQVEIRIETTKRKKEWQLTVMFVIQVIMSLIM